MLMSVHSGHMTLGIDAANDEVCVENGGLVLRTYL